MHNPKNWKNSSRAKLLKIWMNQRITRRRGKCVFLCDLSCDLDWQLAIETSETAPSRAPPVYPVHGRSPNKQWLCAGVFFLPSPSLSPILTRQPLPWNHFLTRSNSRSVSTSTPALQFSFAVTWDLTWDQAQFARFGFFRFHARRNVIYKAKTKIEHDLRLAL